MDGIAAIGARISEIQARVAQLSQGPDAPLGGDRSGRFASALAEAAATRTAAGGVRASGGHPQAPGRTAAIDRVTGAGAPGAARIDGWIDQAIAATGVPAEWAPHLKTIAEHESGFDPFATNGNDPVGGGRTQRVVGLMQMLPSTFEAHMAAGHTDIYNPVDNLISSIRYIKGRYGDAANVPGVKALAVGNAYRGY